MDKPSMTWLCLGASPKTLPIAMAAMQNAQLMLTDMQTAAISQQSEERLSELFESELSPSLLIQAFTACQVLTVDQTMQMLSPKTESGPLTVVVDLDLTPAATDTMQWRAISQDMRKISDRAIDQYHWLLLGDNALGGAWYQALTDAQRIKRWRTGLVLAVPSLDSKTCQVHGQTTQSKMSELKSAIVWLTSQINEMPTSIVK